MATIATSVAKTHRALIAHEAVLNGGVGAEIAARIGTVLFDELDAPVRASDVLSRRSPSLRSSSAHCCPAARTSFVLCVNCSASKLRRSKDVALVAKEIPKVGLVMEAVRVIRWLKKVGDTVALGEPLVEVETEKSVVEIEATASGRLAEILVQVGQEASVGDQIARIEADAAQRRRKHGEAAGTRDRTVRPKAATLEPHAGDRIRSSPVARKVAAEHGLDLGGIAGSGPRGRVQLEDVKRAIGTP